MSTPQLSVQQYFVSEIFRDRNGPCEIKNVYLQLTSGGTNQSVISAVTGKRVRVIEGFFRHGGATATVITFKSASAGTSLRGYHLTATATDIHRIPWNPFGEMETITGEGLFVDNSGAVTPIVSLRYIEWTP